MLQASGLLPDDVHRRAHQDLNIDITGRIVASLNAEKVRNVFALDFNIDNEFAAKVTGIFSLVDEFATIAHSWYFDLGVMKKEIYCQQLSDLIRGLFRNFIKELDFLKRDERWLQIIKLNLLLSAFFCEIQVERVQCLAIDFSGLKTCREELLSLLQVEDREASAQLVKIQEGSVLSAEMNAILRLRSFGEALGVFVAKYGKESACFALECERSAIFKVDFEVCCFLCVDSLLMSRWTKLTKL